MGRLPALLPLGETGYSKGVVESFAPRPEPGLSGAT
jgi:hypothetical protein